MNGNPPSSLSARHHRLFSGRRILVFAVLGAIACIAGWISSLQLRARANLDRGKTAIENKQPELARDYLDKCLATWPMNPEPHFYAARAARQCGDYVTAGRHLDDAMRYGWDRNAIRAERNLLVAQTGDLTGVEGELLAAIYDRAPESPQILAILVPLYLEQYRLHEATKLTEIWIELEPNSALAWQYRGDTFERLQRKGDAIRAYREAVRLNPNDDRSRFSLVRLLLDARLAPDEVKEHLSYLSERYGTDRNVQMAQALSLELTGLVDAAIAEYDRMIADYPNFAPAYYLRGRLELNRGNPEAAKSYLKRAAELDPSDIPTHYSYFQCMQQVGTPEEARQAEKHWKEVSSDLERVAEIAKKIAKNPTDPDLRLQIGRLFLKHGRDKEGIQWLESALKVQSDHEEVHQQLAEYFERKGLKELAKQHRSYIIGSENQRK